MTGAVGLEWPVLLACGNALELLQNYSLSFVSPPQTDLQQIYCLFFKVCGLDCVHMRHAVLELEE